MTQRADDHACGSAASAATTVWVTERFWPGCTNAEALAACDALRRCCAAIAPETTVTFLGATYFPEDETLAARFGGSRSAVVAVHELARTPFDRLSCGVEM